MTSLPPFGWLLPSAQHVPSLWFHTTSTAYSAYRLRVYCTPKPDEVRYVAEIRPQFITSRSL